MNQRGPSRLAVVHGTLACLAGVVALLALLAWPGLGRAQASGSLRTPALAVQVAAVLYLAAASGAEASIAARLGSGLASPPASLWPLMGHVWVFMVVGSSALRGPVSRAYLVGFDRLIAALATISALCLVCLLFTWIVESREGRAPSRKPPTNEPAGAGRRWTWLQLMAGVLLVLSFWWLESQPFDARRGRGSPSPIPHKELTCNGKLDVRLAFLAAPFSMESPGSHGAFFTAD